MTYENTAVAARPGVGSRLANPALATAAVGALLTVLAPFLPWASITLPGEKGATSYNGLADEFNGRFTIYVGIVAVVVVAVLAVKRIKGLWVLLPILGLVVTFVGWAQTQKLQNTVDEITAISADAGAAVHVSNGIGVWLTILGGVLLLATAVLFPMTRRRA